MDQKQRLTRQGFMARVSKLALGDEPLPVRFMYKTIPEHSNDTGWRLFTGYETPEFLEEFANLEPFPLEPMCEADESLRDLLDSNAGTAWERLPEQAWQQVDDFVIPVEEVEVDIL